MLAALAGHEVAAVLLLLPRGDAHEVAVSHGPLHDELRPQQGHVVVNALQHLASLQRTSE